MELMPLEAAQKETEHKCPVCDTPFGEHIPETCPICRFAPRMASAATINRRRIEWQERQSARFNYERKVKEAGETAARDAEEKLRAKIRREIEKEMAAKLGRAPLFSKKIGSTGFLFGLVCAAAAFGGGYWISTVQQKKNTETMAVVQGAAAEDSVEALIDRAQKLAAVTENTPDSLVYLAENAEKTPTAPVPENFVQTARVGTSAAAPQYALSVYSRQMLTADYIDALLAVGQTARAEDFYSSLRDRQPAVLNQSELQNIALHILAVKTAAGQGKPAALAAQIDALGDTEAQIRHLLFAAEALFADEKTAENFLQRTENAAAALNGTQAQTAAAAIAYSRARILALRAQNFAAQGLWGQFAQTENALADMLAQSSGKNRQSIALAAYPVFRLSGNVARQFEAENIFQAASELSPTAGEQEVLLRAWGDNAATIPAPLNMMVFRLHFAPQLNAPDFTADSNTVKIWRVCAVQEMDTCVLSLQNALFRPGVPQTPASFDEALYFFSMIDAMKQAHEREDFTAQEEWLRRLAVELLAG